MNEKAPVIASNETDMPTINNLEKFQLNDYLISKIKSYGLSVKKRENGLVISLDSDATMISSSEPSEDISKERHIFVPDRCVMRKIVTDSGDESGMFISFEILHIDDLRIESYKIKSNSDLVH